MKESNRKKKSFWNFILIPILEFVILFIVGYALGPALLEGILSHYIKDGTLLHSLSKISIWITIIIYCLIIKPDRKVLRALGTKIKGNNIKNAFVGLLFGLGINALLILIAYIHKDISLHLSPEAGIDLAGMLGVSFLVTLISSSGEELLMRGFMYQRFRACSKYPVIAILIPSVLFAVLHLGNPGITVSAFINIILCGILLALMIHFFDSFWMACLWHAGWNFSQAYLFGLPSSGVSKEFSLFKLDSAVARDSFAYNVGFGIEATALTSIILAIIIVAMLIYGIKNKKQPTPVWE